MTCQDRMSYLNLLAQMIQLVKYLPYGFKCIRLSRSTIDLCDASQLEQALGQVEQLPPADNGFASFAHITHHCSA